MSIAMIIIYSLISLIKKKKVNKYAFSLLLAISVVLCSVFLWYIAPFTIDIPNNPAIKVRYDDHDFWLEEHASINSVTILLESLKFQRELIHYDGLFPSGQLVQGDGYFIIELYDSDEHINSFPRHIGDYSFVIMSPDNARFVVPSSNNRYKYKILGVERIYDELHKQLLPY